MKAKTEELLYCLCWTCEMLARPTFRNLTESYESWAYRNGLMRQLARLERQQFLERRGLGPDERLYRLTDKGRLHALGGGTVGAQMGWLLANGRFRCAADRRKSTPRLATISSKSELWLPSEKRLD